MKRNSLRRHELSTRFFPLQMGSYSASRRFALIAALAASCARAGDPAELQRAFDQAAANAGTLASSYC